MTFFPNFVCQSVEVPMYTLTTTPALASAPSQGNSPKLLWCFYVILASLTAIPFFFFFDSSSRSLVENQGVEIFPESPTAIIWQPS